MDIPATGAISGLIDSTSVFYLTGVYLDGPQSTSSGSSSGVGTSSFTATGAPVSELAADSTAGSPPASLDFTGDHSFPTLSPALDQVFFIGDGLTGTGTGNEQYFQVPAGATDLYLGFADAEGFDGPPGTYANDSGSLSATVNLFTGQYSAASSGPSKGTLLGGLNVAGYCAAVPGGTSQLAKGGISGTNYAYDNWECTSGGGPLTMTKVCQWEYPSQSAHVVAKATASDSAYSWECFVGLAVARHRAASTGDVNIVKDGRFEDPTANGAYQTFQGGATFGPWHVTGNSVDLVTTGFIAARDSTQDVDLAGSNFNGSSAGGVYQNLTTTPGQSYTLTYWESANGGGPPTTKEMTVRFDGKVVGSTPYTVGNGNPYVEHSFRVVATSSSSRLAFSTTVTTNYGPVLDDVAMVPAGTGAGQGNIAPIAASIGTPNQIFHSMGHNLVNAAITVAAILFITFPSVIFNQTFSSNYAEILLIVANFRRRIRKAFGLKARPEGEGATTDAAKDASSTASTRADAPGRTSRPWFYGVLVAGAILGGLLNPKFGVNERSLADIGATLVAFAFGTLIGWFISKTFRQHHHYKTHTYLHALPLGLAVAALCVLVSRLTNFEPGYLYGVVVSIAFVETLEERHNAHLTAISTLSTLGVALVAWFLWVPVNHFALEHSGNVLLAIVDDVLASIFIGGLVGTVIGLLPLEFMPGGTIAKWRKDVWAIVFFVAIFLLVEIELRPAAGPTHPGGAPIVTALVLFAIFGGGTFWMRHFFAKRKAARDADASPVTTTVATPLDTEAATEET